MSTLTGCSSDIQLFDDYKLYDLDGSNQVIIGNQGMTSVRNVTAFATQKPLIFVEIGGDHLPPTFKRKCAYKMLDTSKHSIVDLSAGTRPQQIATAAIKAQKQGVVYRSCALPR